MAPPPDLTPDDLVQNLRPDPNQPPSIERQGFLGESDRPNYCRLYLTRALTDYLEIANADIVYREKGKDADAGSRIWIKPTAMVREGPPKEVRAADLQTQNAATVNAVSCCHSGGERSTMAVGLNPMIFFFMGPYMCWTMAAQFCSAAAYMLGGGMVGPARISRSCAAPSDKSLCSGDGKAILLGPRDYKVISCC
jgi:hypothetical protein